MIKVAFGRGDNIAKNCILKISLVKKLLAEILRQHLFPILLKLNAYFNERNINKYLFGIFKKKYKTIKKRNRILK